MNRRRLTEKRREDRRRALELRDRFYREAAAGAVPAPLADDLRLAAVALHDVVTAYEPVGQHRDFAGVDFINRAENPTIPTDDIDMTRCVEVIDELDAAAREYGAPQVEA